MTDVRATHTSRFPSVIDENNPVTFTNLAQSIGVRAQNVRFGKFRRNVDPKAQVTTSSDKMIPDSATNSHVSTGSNHKISTMTNLITEYTVNYNPGPTTLVDHNLSTVLNDNAPNWEHDKDKNIAKRVNINTGRFHGANPASASGAVIINDSYLNLDIEFNNSDLRGVGGQGGANNASSVNDVNTNKGGNGGNALYINNTINSGNNTTKKVNISWGTNAKFYGGGGGGGGGKDGTTSGSIKCDQQVETSSQQQVHVTNQQQLHTGQHSHRGQSNHDQQTQYRDRYTVKSRQQNTYYQNPTVRRGGAGGIGAGSGGTFGRGNLSVAASSSSGSGECRGTWRETASIGGGAGGNFGLKGSDGFSPGGKPGKWLKKGGSTLVGHPDTNENTNKGEKG